MRAIEFTLRLARRWKDLDISGLHMRAARAPNIHFQSW